MELTSSYPTIALEVAGPAAMFMRPDTGATPMSYPAPTYSAAKGMFEAVTWRSSVYIGPTCVEICKPIRYERYITNYGGPLRNVDQIRRNNNYQLVATILVDVHYRIYAEVKEKERSGRGDHARWHCMRWHATSRGYGASISLRSERTFWPVASSILPRRFTNRFLSTVRIWSRTICPVFLWNLIGTRVG